MADIIEIDGSFFNMDKFIQASEGAGKLWVKWEGEDHKKVYSGETAEALLAALKERSQ